MIHPESLDVERIGTFPTHKVVAVLPTYKRPHCVARVLEQMNAVQHPAWGGVIVVNDDPEDSIDEGVALRHQASSVSVLQGTGDLLWAGAVELGSRQAIDAGESTHLLWVNDDVQFDAECIERALGVSKANPAMVISALLIAGNIEDFTKNPSHLGMQHTKLPMPALFPANTSDANFVIVPISAFLAVGGLHPERFPHFADGRFFRAVAAKGVPICVASSVRVSVQYDIIRHLPMWLRLLCYPLYSAARQLIWQLSDRRSMSNPMFLIHYYADLYPSSYLVRFVAHVLKRWGPVVFTLPLFLIPWSVRRWIIPRLPALDSRFRKPLVAELACVAATAPARPTQGSTSNGVS